MFAVDDPFAVDVQFAADVRFVVVVGFSVNDDVEKLSIKSGGRNT